MATLHVIGNGFDLSHGFETSYNDFRKFALRKDSTWVCQFENCYTSTHTKSGKFELWCDLERTMGDLDFNLVFDEATEDIEPEEEHEIRYISQMEDVPGFYLSPVFEKFHEIFEEWICNIKIYERTLKNIPHFDKNGLFISFNYTETVEKVYGISRKNINYVHGRRHTSDKLVVGHNKKEVDYNNLLSESPEIYEYEAYREIARIFNKQRKKISSIYDGNDCYWHSLAGVDKVVVYGHSLNEIDSPYFEQIVNDISDNAVWYFSIFYDSMDEQQKIKEEERIRRFCKSIGISKYETFRMPQFGD